MSPAQSAARLTPQEYLAIERAAAFKSEFHDGQMYAMATGPARHSLIATNVTAEFGNKLRSKNCVPYNADLRIQVEPTGLFTYPDLSVICGPIQFGAGDDTVTNPTLLVEVLSPSTEAYDRGQKFIQYRQIPSLQEYLLVSQSEPLLELYSRQPGDGLWTLRQATGLDARLEIPSLEITVELSEIYARVQFPPQPLRVVPGK